LRKGKANIKREKKILKERLRQKNKKEGWNYFASLLANTNPVDDEADK